MDIFEIISRAVNVHDQYTRAVRIVTESNLPLEEAILEAADETNVHPLTILRLLESAESPDSGGWKEGSPELSGTNLAEPSSKGDKKRKKKSKKFDIEAPSDRKVFPNKRENSSEKEEVEDDDEEVQDEDKPQKNMKSSEDDEAGDEEPKKKMPSFKKAQKDDGADDEDPEFQEKEGGRTDDARAFAGDERDTEDKEPRRKGPDPADVPVGKTVVLINPKERDDFETDNEGGQNDKNRRK